MKTRIIIGAIIIAACPAICVDKPAKEKEETPQHDFVHYIEMPVVGGYLAADHKSRLSQGNKLLIIARGYTVKYYTETPDGENKSAETIIFDDVSGTATAPAPDVSEPAKVTGPALPFDITSCKKLYPGLKGVELTARNFATVILEDEAPGGENLVFHTTWKPNPNVKDKKKFEISQPAFINFCTVGSKNTFETVTKSWLPLNGRLFIGFRGYNITYQAQRKNGTLTEAKLIKWKDQKRKLIPHPDEEFIKYLESEINEPVQKYEYHIIELNNFSDGDNLIINYSNAGNQSINKNEAFKVYGSPWAFVQWQSFSISTVFNIELGKKETGGATGEGFSAGPGGNIPLVYKRFPDSETWDKVGLALSINAAPSEVLNEETQETENVLAWTGSVLGIAKLEASPLLILAGAGAMRAGHDWYLIFNFGFGAEIYPK